MSTRCARRGACLRVPTRLPASREAAHGGRQLSQRTVAWLASQRTWRRWMTRSRRWGWVGRRPIPSLPRHHPSDPPPLLPPPCGLPLARACPWPTERWLARPVRALPTQHPLCTYYSFILSVDSPPRLKCMPPHIRAHRILLSRRRVSGAGVGLLMLAAVRACLMHLVMGGPRKTEDDGLQNEYLDAKRHALMLISSSVGMLQARGRPQQTRG